MLRIIKAISLYTKVSMDEIKSKTRKKEIVIARHLFHYFIKQKTNWTNARIGFMTKKDGATVIHSCSVIKNFLEIKDPITVELTNKIENYVRNNDSAQRTQVRPQNYRPVMVSLQSKMVNGNKRPSVSPTLNAFSRIQQARMGKWRISQQ